MSRVLLAIAAAGALILTGCIQVEPDASEVQADDVADVPDPELSATPAQGSPPTALEVPEVVACGDQPPPPIVALSWQAFGDTPRLALSLRADITAAVAVDLSYMLVAGGYLHRAPLRTLVLTPANTGDEMTIDLDALAPPGLNLDAITLSGALHVAAVVTDSAGQYLGRRSAPPLHFHPDGGTMVTYGTDLLEQQYNGGDFLGTRPNLVGAGERQLGWVAGGFGLPPEVVAQMELEDPGE